MNLKNNRNTLFEYMKNIYILPSLLIGMRMIFNLKLFFRADFVTNSTENIITCVRKTKMVKLFGVITISNNYFASFRIAFSIIDTAIFITIGG